MHAAHQRDRIGETSTASTSAPFIGSAVLRDPHPGNVLLRVRRPARFRRLLAPTKQIDADARSSNSPLIARRRRRTATGAAAGVDAGRVRRRFGDLGRQIPAVHAAGLPVNRWSTTKVTMTHRRGASCRSRARGEVVHRHARAVPPAGSSSSREVDVLTAARILGQLEGDGQLVPHRRRMGGTTRSRSPRWGAPGSSGASSAAARAIRLSSPPSSSSSMTGCSGWCHVDLDALVETSAVTCR